MPKPPRQHRDRRLEVKARRAIANETIERGND